MWLTALIVLSVPIGLLVLIWLTRTREDAATRARRDQTHALHDEMRRQEGRH